MLNITDKGIMKGLWISLGFTYPFFAVEFLRVNLLGMHIAIPMLVHGMIIAFGCLLYLGGGKEIVQRPLYTRDLWVLLGICTYLFFLWHLFSLIRADETMWALREVIKLGMGLLVLWSVIIFFPRDKQIIERFLLMIIWASAGLMGFLIYQYAFVFEVPFLGGRLDEGTKVGRNQLAWYIIFVLPYAFSYLWFKKRKLFFLLPLTVLIAAWVYVSSRGAWVSVVVGVVFIGFVIIRTRRDGLKKAFTFFIGISIVGFMGGWAVTAFLGLEKLEFIDRMTYFNSPARLKIIDDALQYFMQSPLIGAGLTNTAIHIDFLTHNDYIAILSDLGIIGEIIFIGTLAVSCTGILLKKPYLGKNDLLWISLGTRGTLVAILVSMLVINVYTTVLFWAFLGLVVVVWEMEKKDGMVASETNRVPAIPEIIRLSEGQGGA